jgi:hypothetical protein
VAIALFANKKKSNGDFSIRWPSMQTMRSISTCPGKRKGNRHYGIPFSFEQFLYLLI